MAHIHEKVDFVVEAFIVHGDKVLMVNHRSAKTWLPVGGHIELDEDPEVALFREIEEESGLKKSDLKIYSEKLELNNPGYKSIYPPTYFDIHDIDTKPGHRHAAFVYFFASSTDKIMLKEDEHLDIRWFSKEDIESQEYNLKPAIKTLAKKAVEIVS